MNYLKDTVFTVAILAKVLYLLCIDCLITDIIMTDSDRCCRYDPKRCCMQPKRIGSHYCSQTCQDHSDIQDAINAEWQRFYTQDGIKTFRNRIDSKTMYNEYNYANNVFDRMLEDVHEHNVRVEKEQAYLDRAIRLFEATREPQQSARLDHLVKMITNFNKNLRTIIVSFLVVDHDEISRLQSVVEMATEVVDDLRMRLQNVSVRCSHWSKHSLHYSIVAIQMLALESNEKVYELEGERRIEQTMLNHCKSLAKTTGFNTSDSRAVKVKIEQITARIQEIDNEIEFERNKYSRYMIIADDKYRTVLFVNYVLNSLEY